jgi:hypothetical protein
MKRASRRHEHAKAAPGTAGTPEPEAGSNFGYFFSRVHSNLEFRAAAIFWLLAKPDKGS